MLLALKYHCTVAMHLIAWLQNQSISWCAEEMELDTGALIGFAIQQV
jgi:hypothetical protein